MTDLRNATNQEMVEITADLHPEVKRNLESYASDRQLTPREAAATLIAQSLDREGYV